MGYLAPGVRLTGGLIRDQRRNDVTGGTPAFPAGTAPRQRHRGLTGNTRFRARATPQGTLGSATAT